MKVGESYMKVQYFKYDALLVENGRKFTIFNPGVSDVNLGSLGDNDLGAQNAFFLRCGTTQSP